ncbi:MAG TPA: hypothetical protein VIV11_16180, partial [Kofleriaceae bacterium]
MPWLVLVIAAGCGSNPSGTDPDASNPPPEDAMGPPVLECGDPDVDAPVVWSMSPANRAIGVDASAPLVFDVADGCGIDMSTVVFRIAGTELTPTITGDAKNLRIQYDAPVGGFT